MNFRQRFAVLCVLDSITKYPPKDEESATPHLPKFNIVYNSNDPKQDSRTPVRYVATPE